MSIGAGKTGVLLPLTSVNDACISGKFITVDIWLRHVRLIEKMPLVEMMDETGEINNGSLGVTSERDVY